CEQGRGGGGAGGGRFIEGRATKSVSATERTYRGKLARWGRVKLPRRTFLHLMGAPALLAISRIARAQAYPARPVRLVVGFPAGGTNDIHARLIADWLSRQIGRSFIVENRPGAAGNIGLESVVRAVPDGYTLSVCGSTELRNEILYNDLKFSFMHDTAPVASMTLAMNVLVVHPASSIQSVPEL